MRFAIVVGRPASPVLPSRAHHNAPVPANDGTAGRHDAEQSRLDSEDAPPAAVLSWSRKRPARQPARQTSPPSPVKQPQQPRPPANTPAHAPPHMPGHAPRPAPASLHGLDPATLWHLRCNVPLQIPVTAAEVAAWEDRHNIRALAHRTDARLPYEYNERSNAFIVKCMPSPLHDAASTFFYDSAHASLVATLDPDVSYAAHGVALTMGAEVTGFCGLPGLSGRSRKVPDFALLLGFRAKFPGLAVEVGFAESFAALVQDAGLLLLGTAETTRVVVVVKLYEGAAAAHADMPWPADVAVPPVEASVAVKEAVEARLQDHLLDTAHVASLVGAITGEAAVYTRLADVALISSAMRPLAPGTPAVAVAEEADCPGIACVYRYTFMTDDIPAGVDAVAGSEQALDTDTPLPWVLTFPLAVLHPAEAGFRAPASLAFHNQQDPVLGSNSSGIITFDLLALAKHINRRRPHMEVWRAKYIAAGIMERWHIQTGELRNQQHAAVIQQQPQPRPPLSSSPLSQPRPPLSALPLSQVSNNTDNTVRGDGKHNLRPKRLASTTHPRTSKNETWATYKKAKLQTSEEGEDGEADENDAEKKVHNDDDDVDDDPDWLP